MEEEERDKEHAEMHVLQRTEVPRSEDEETSSSALKQEVLERSADLDWDASARPVGFSLKTMEWPHNVGRETMELPVSIEKEIVELPANLSAGLQSELRVRNASVARTSVGDLAGRLLEHVGNVRPYENGESTQLERRLNMEWSVPDKKTKQETATERLYGRVSTVFLRQTGGEHRSVVVTTQENAQGAGLNVRDVDRAFQRDARRYDGGLHLL